MASVEETDEQNVPVAREILEALIELLSGQTETIRLAAHWTNYEGDIETGAETALAKMREHGEESTAGLDAAADYVFGESGLSESQAREAFRRAIREFHNHSDRAVLRKSTSLLYARARIRSRDWGLLSSQLVTLVADFELFVLRVMTAWSRHDTTHIANRKKEYTLRELGELGSIDEMREAIIHSYLDEHMRNGWETWSATFATVLGTKIEGAGEFYLLEALQRRHVIVHHGGVVSRQYLEKLQRFDTEVELGDPLPIDFDYIQSAADAIAAAAHSVALAAIFKAAKTRPEKSAAWSEAGELTYQLLVDRRDEVVRRFSETFDLERVLDEFSRELMRVNGFIAHRRLFGPEAIRARVEAWDTSAKDDQFKIARAVLLGDVRAALPLARRLIAAETLSQYAIATWPLYEDVSTELLALLDQDPGEEQPRQIEPE